MRKSVFYLVFGIALVTVVLIFTRIYKNENAVTYERVDEYGIVFDVPDDYRKVHSELLDANSYQELSGDFQITVFDFVNEEKTVEEYITEIREAFISGLFDNEAYISQMVGDPVSNIRLREHGIEDNNGIEMGYMTFSYELEEKKKSTRMIEKIYLIDKGDKFIQLGFVYEPDDKDKYAEIVDHVVGTVEMK